MTLNAAISLLLQCAINLSNAEHRLGLECCTCFRLKNLYNCIQLQSDSFYCYFIEIVISRG